MPIPVTVPTLSDDYIETDEELDIAPATEIAEYGWIKVDSEWMQYAGVDRYAGSGTLTNVVRGLSQGSNAIVHNNGDIVYFGVAMPKNELYRVLMDQSIVHLNELFLGNASSKEKQTHQELIGFYEGRVKEFWRNWSDTKVVKTQVDISAWINL
jgi:hypothetical protein